METLRDQPVRSSLQVAPLALQKGRSQDGDNASDTASSSNPYVQPQITPPTTPHGSQEDLNATINVPVFHSFLRAFYPFHPSYVTTDATVTLPLNDGDVVLVHSIHTNGWADGTLLADGARGWLPTNYCEAYEPDEMKNLLKALLNFWDLLRSNWGTDNEMFGNQEFMKGIIVGVRYLLERTHCLSRDSPIVQRHDGLRRSRKSLLSELSSLVKTAKRLQETERMVDPEEEINVVVDDMILKAFKIVTKGVRFLDILEDDRRARASAIGIMGTLLEEPCVPPTPPADSATFDNGQEQACDADSRVGENGTVAEPAPSEPSEVAHDQHPTNKRLSAAYSMGTNARRLSHGSSSQSNRLSSTIQHRVSLAGPPALSRSQNLVSARLSSCHDLFLSHLGSFIGRLQVQTQSRPHLALAIKQSVTSGGELLVVVDVVCSHSSPTANVLDHYRAAMYDRLQDLVHTARDILTIPGPDMEDVIVEQDNGHLLGAATGCVKATGECVAKVRWVIERIGDFEFEFDNGSLGVDFDLSALDALRGEESKPGSCCSASVSESTVSEAPTASTTVSATSPTMPRPTALSIDKPLPEVPQVTSPLEDGFGSRPSPPASRSQSIVAVDNASNTGLAIQSLRSSLPALPKISTSLLPAADYSPTEPSAATDVDFMSFRTESMTASSSGSGSTYLSRDSESSLMSQTSTRATTPDSAQAPRSQPSLSELSVAESSAPTEEVDEVESRLLARTYAHELVFNKEGQVTGGTLQALVERLTTHEAIPDAVFVSTFYLTFRLFCTPAELAEVLIDRFDYIGESPENATTVTARLRTFNVFKGWLESHWKDEADAEALPLIKHFAQFKLSSVNPPMAKRLVELTDRVAQCDASLVPRLASSMAPSVPADATFPTPVISRSQLNSLSGWKAGGSSPSILDFDPLEVARQLTIKQVSLFCSITPDELLGSRWMKEEYPTPNVKAMSSFTTSLSHLVADTILQYEEVKKRAAVIKQWIKIANHCEALHNYDALVAITCALTDTSIKRLRITWENVSLKRKEMLKTLQSIIHCEKNFKVLRSRYHDRVPPCLPFVGMFLTDLAMLNDGNPATKMTNTGLTVINFDKHMRTAKSIGELLRFQIPYRLTDVPDLQEWLWSQIDRLRDEKKVGAEAQVQHYRKSLLLEPREAQQMRTSSETASSTSTVSTSMFGWMRSNSTTTPALPAQV